jgi:hypothetical protein
MEFSMERKIIYIFIFLILTISCSKQESCYLSSGRYSEIKIQLNNFDRLYINGRINLDLIQDSSNYLILKGGENLINSVKIKNENNLLDIKDLNKCYWLRNYDNWINIELHYKNINYINPEIYGDMLFKNTCIQESLNIEVWNAAFDITGEVNLKKFIFRSHGGIVGLHLRGVSEYIYTYLHGSGPQHLENLCSDTVAVNHSSNQNIYICADSVLWVDINSSGNVYYKGNPQQKIVNYRGTGQVIEMK